MPSTTRAPVTHVIMLAWAVGSFLHCSVLFIFFWCAVDLCLGLYMPYGAAFSFCRSARRSKMPSGAQHGFQGCRPRPSSHHTSGSSTSRTILSSKRYRHDSSSHHVHLCPHAQDQAALLEASACRRRPFTVSCHPCTLSYYSSTLPCVVCKYTACLAWCVMPLSIWSVVVCAATLCSLCAVFL